MILTPEDISTFIFCPYLFYIKKKILDLKPLSLFEKCVINAIKDAELHCCLNNTDLYARKIIPKWDKIWWPEIAKQKEISFQKAQELSVRASSIFVDYCKYDISWPQYPTLGTDIKSELQIGRSIIKTNADIIKANLNIKEQNIQIIGFGNTRRETTELILDPAIRTLAYSFFSGKEKIISYTYICVREKLNKLFVTSVVLRQEDMDEIRKMLNYVENGIKNSVRFMNPYNCKECKQCKNFKY